ncbi:unnamed protein product [Adineta steineri]|uniref:NAD(P)(+)--arginine ADP-ribosyltransferase n=1 Tax=Adineta steineri TaxID=433720 RepID=A0A815QR85_9BILA|nr:unnamed protein product [Adineta steineri]CAF1634361.1 unnamed protein product [Adineta steineri]
MSSQSSLNDMVTTMKLVEKYLYQIGCPVLIVIGTISCIINLIVFSQKNLRKNPCSIYFIAYNLANFIYIYSSLLSLTLNIGYKINANIYHLALCRVFLYTVALFNSLSSFYLILASIDRILITSRNAITRRKSTRRLAYLCIIVGTLFWALVHAHLLIFSTITQITPNSFLCYYQPGIHLTFMGYYSIIKEISALLLLTICGLWSIKNIHSLHHMRIVLNLSVTKNVIETNSSSGKDRQLFSMLLMDIIIYAVFSFIFSIFLMYQQITQNQIKTSDRIQIETVIRDLCLFSAGIPFCLGCYTNLFVSKTFRTDIRYEPKQILEPICGYEQEPLVSLEEACQPLANILSKELELYVTIAKLNSKEPKDGLTQDESASIYLYTMQWEKIENSLYALFNQALRAIDRSTLKPWLKYMKLFFTAFFKLPFTEYHTVWRGVPDDLSKLYQEGEELTWWSLSSTTSSFDVLQSPMYLGRENIQTIFSIETKNGKLLRAHSHLQNDDEILLLPGTCLKVIGSSNPSNGVYIISLREIPSNSLKLAKPFDLTSTNELPLSPQFCKADIQHLLNYIDILYPNGEPINLETGRDENGIPFYRDEMYHFYGLAGTWAENYDYDLIPTYRMSQNPEYIAKATWTEIKQMLTCLCSSGKFSSYTTYAHAITAGYIRLILLRMKELVEL